MSSLKYNEKKRENISLKVKFCGSKLIHCNFKHQEYSYSCKLQDVNSFLASSLPGSLKLEHCYGQLITTFVSVPVEKQ